MIEDEKITVICVDFGMTGSSMSSCCVINRMLTPQAFMWRNGSCLTWSLLPELKTPINLVFDTDKEDGSPVAWGSVLWREYQRMFQGIHGRQPVEVRRVQRTQRPCVPNWASSLDSGILASFMHQSCVQYRCQFSFIIREEIENRMKIYGARKLEWFCR